MPRRNPKQLRLRRFRIFELFKKALGDENLVEKRSENMLLTNENQVV